MTRPEIHTFQNGLRLVYESPKSKLTQTYIRLFCHVGSINEPTDLRGAAHFIEHMCFKGTRHFPSWSAVNEPFTQSGAFFNAATDKQYTVYKINCLDLHVREFLRILAEMMLLSKFDKSEYNLERNVVKEEVNIRKPDSYVENLVFSGTPYQDWIDHTSFHKSGCLPHNSVVEFYRKYYIPQNMVLSVVSSLPLATILRHLAVTEFAKHAPYPTVISPILNIVPGAMSASTACESKYVFQSTESDTTRIEIGVRVCNQFQMDEYHALNVLRHILAGGMSSRLFVELREKRGLTYNSGAYMILYEPAGAFIIHAATDVNRLITDGGKKGVIAVLFEIIDDLIRHGVKDSEVKHAKVRIHEQLKMNDNWGEERSSYNGLRVMLHNETDIITNDKMYDTCYNPINKSDVNAVIQKYFAPRQFYFSAVGGKLPNKNKLIRFLGK